MTNAILVINFETPGINPRLCANSRESFLNACERWGCELIEISHNNWVLDMAPAAVKTQLFSKITAERVLVLDSDIVINSQAPNPFELFPKEKMVIVENATRRFGEYEVIKQIEREEWIKVEAEFGPAPYVAEHYFNSGVMLVHRDYHKQVFELASEIYFHLSSKNIGLGWVDQTPFNYAVKKLGIDTLITDESWNYVHPEQLPDWMNMKKHIYHFAGCPQRNEWMPQINWK